MFVGDSRKFVLAKMSRYMVYMCKYKWKCKSTSDRERWPSSYIVVPYWSDVKTFCYIIRGYPVIIVWCYALLPSSVVMCVVRLVRRWGVAQAGAPPTTTFSVPTKPSVSSFRTRRCTASNTPASQRGRYSIGQSLCFILLLFLLSLAMTPERLSLYPFMLCSSSVCLHQPCRGGEAYTHIVHTFLLLTPLMLHLRSPFYLLQL